MNRKRIGRFVLLTGLMVAVLTGVVWYLAGSAETNEPRLIRLDRVESGENDRVLATLKSLRESEPDELRRMFAEPPDSPRLDEIKRSTYYRLGRYLPEGIAMMLKAEDIYYNMFAVREGMLTPSQRDRYNELHMVPWNPQTGMDCSKPVDYELPPSVRVCSAIYEREPSHAYELLSPAELEAIPDDPAAIYHLAMHLEVKRDVQERFAVLRDATALADKPGELLQFGYFLSGGASFPDNIEYRRMRLVLEYITHAMGDERSRFADREAEYLETLLLLGEPVEESLDSAREEARTHLIEMSEKRRAVFGLPLTIKEDF